MKYISLLFCVLTINVWSQSQSNSHNYKQLDSIFSHLKELEFSKGLHLINEFNPEYSEKLNILITLISLNNQVDNNHIKIKIDTSKFKINNRKDNYELALSSLIQGYYKLTDISSRPKAYSYFYSAYQSSLKSKYAPLIKESILAILKLYRLGLLHADDSFLQYFNIYRTYCEDTIDHILYESYLFNLTSQTNIYGSSTRVKDSIFNSTISKLDSLSKRLPQNSKWLVQYYLDKANQEIKVDPENAKILFKKSLTLCDTSLFFKPYKFSINLHLSRTEAAKNNYKTAFEYIRLAEKFKNDTDSTKDDFFLNIYKAEYHSKLKNYDSAYYSMRTSRYLEYELDIQNQNAQISKIKVELDTVEKEKQVLINRNIAFGLGGLLLFGGITFLLIQKNTKRKQLLAEQEKELQTQKLATVLKEQELTSIDAMIEGQEKERQRIANDLHDDLGGLMATVKLHFNALKEKQSPELYDKTDKLLDEAYNKVRSVAHTKNSGVMAKKGLLKAINDMAKTISASNKLQIDVIDHGLESRLENSLELTIFRIIQELVTNIIKHAEATEATIHITNHDDSLNIMVEDNGKGFNTKKISKKNGMGIHSIDKRIENLGGTVTIESELNKGTTVIIDIPS